MSDWNMSELDGMDRRLETKTTSSPASAKKTTKRPGRKKPKRRMSMMSQLEAQMEEEDNNASNQAGGISASSANRRKGKNRRMSTNISAAQMAMENRASGASHQINVFLLDGSEVSISVTKKTKVRHALLMIKDILQLENDADFGLFALHNGFAVGTYHLLGDESLLHNSLDDWTDKQQDVRYLSIGDPDSRLGKNSAGPRHLVLKRRLYLPWSPLHIEIKNATSIDDTAHKMEYMECVHHIMFSRYPVSKDRAVKIAGLMLQQELGDYAASKYPKAGSLQRYMQKFLPIYTLEGRKINKYEARAVKEWKQLNGYTPLESQRTIIEYCKYWFPWYGCEFFRIDYQRKQEQGETRGHMLTGITLAIGHGGLHFLYRTHGQQSKIQPRMLLASHKYASIDKWITAKSGKVFSFYLGTDDLCFAVSPQASYIEVLVREYIFEFMEVTELMKKKNNGTLPISPARSRQGTELEDHLSSASTASAASAASTASVVSPAQIMRALLPGKENENAVRIPYDRFSVFYQLTNGCLSHQTCDQYLNTICEPRALGSAVSVNAFVQALGTLSEETRHSCMAAARGVDSNINEVKTAAAAAVVVPQGWQMVEDQTSGRMYYVHTASGASQWTTPTVDNSTTHTNGSGSSKTNGWVEIEDPASGKVYFFNEATGETSWHPASGGDIEEVATEDQPSALASRRSSMAFAFDHGDTTETGNLETVLEHDEEDEDEDEDEEEEVWNDSEDDMDLGGNDWAQMTDETTGKEYYVNNKTGQSQCRCTRFPRFLIGLNCNMLRLMD